MQVSQSERVGQVRLRALAGLLVSGLYCTALYCSVLYWSPTPSPKRNTRHMYIAGHEVHTAAHTSHRYTTAAVAGWSFTAAPTLHSYWRKLQQAGRAGYGRAQGEEL